MQVDLKVMFGDSWRMLGKVLSHDIEMAMDAYWSRIRREELDGQLISPSAEVSWIEPILQVVVLTGC